MSAPYQAVILAAGRGSRLGQETDTRPKALLPIGPRAEDDPAETSFLQRQVELLQLLGVEQVVVVIGYLRKLMETEIGRWAPSLQLVVNPTPQIETSGSLHSFQFAALSTYGVLDGRHQTLLMDADIVYHRDVLRKILQAPETSTVLVCDRHQASNEEVLVYGTAQRPLFMGKGLTSELVTGAPCLGEASGIVKFAPQDHALVRRTMAWLLGDPDAPAGSLEHRGFGPARRATEHEELTERFMRCGRMRGLTFAAEKLPFLEVDTDDEYRTLREELYPRLLAMEAAS
jgi:choline kinase